MIRPGMASDAADINRIYNHYVLNSIATFEEKPVSLEVTEQLIDRINAAGEAHVTRTVLAGRTVLRVSIGARTTERQHVEALWASISAG